MIQKNVREFMRKEILPVAEQIDKEDQFPSGIWPLIGLFGIIDYPGIVFLNVDFQNLYADVR